MISLRFPKDLEEKLTELSLLERKTKTDILKESFLQYLKKKEVSKNAYALGLKYIGKYNSGKADKSINYKAIIKEKLKSKIND
ncbi:transcriptional regulator [Leptospira sp. GIMC2001]|uniref:transcriptional regulator n=1 Tax=Leptospira sp. GIMC2001 TaxID=1513297 RepID=UPI00234A90C3|nr:transcriptional regulator [Leptospira sp. GIMC2001]WCL50642.1 transcriptional regulator [Leptospira sp. GIMC2001]